MTAIAEPLSVTYCMNPGNLHRERKVARIRVLGARNEKALILCESCFKALKKEKNVELRKVRNNEETYRIVPGYSNVRPKHKRASRPGAGGTNGWDVRREREITALFEAARKLAEELDKLEDANSEPKE